MCNQVYQLRNKGNKDKQCPYLDLFNVWRNEFHEKVNPPLVHSITLPIDHLGKCIFHSVDIQWKIKNDFCNRFEDLIILIRQDKKIKEVDFREFIFIGTNDTSSKEKYSLKLLNHDFEYPVVFDDAKFKESIQVKGIKFSGKVSFRKTEFNEAVFFENCTMNGADFDRATFNNTARFSDIIFTSYTTFIGAKFLNGLKLDKSVFKHVVYFDDCLFAVKNIFKSVTRFLKVVFDYTLGFDNAVFECAVLFENVEFKNKADFLDTQFNLKQSVNAVQNTVEFKDIIVRDAGILSFASTNESNKIFNQDVGFRYAEEDLEGLIRFENANFQYITQESQKRLKHSEKLGKVEIGKGCLKYRLRSQMISLEINQANQNIIIEIIQTFANYFTRHNGFNLGIEILERNDKRISYIFFSDENISPEEFENRLKETEYDLWDLLFIKKDDIPLKNRLENQGSSSDLIKTIDGISSLISTLFRVKVRADMGHWPLEATSALVQAFNFNQPPRIVIENLHSTIIENYNQEILIDLSSDLNQNITNDFNANIITYVNKNKNINFNDQEE